jgi:hypothetical protein
MPVAGGIFKHDPHIFTGLGLFSCSDMRCGTRRISAGEGFGIGALDLIGPTSGMFHYLINHSDQGNLLTLLGIETSNAFEAQEFPIDHRTRLFTKNLMPT